MVLWNFFRKLVSFCASQLLFVAFHITCQFQLFFARHKIGKNRFRFLFWLICQILFDGPLLKPCKSHCAQPRAPTIKTLSQGEKKLYCETLFTRSTKSYCHFLVSESRITTINEDMSKFLSAAPSFHPTDLAWMLKKFKYVITHSTLLKTNICINSL